MEKVLPVAQFVLCLGASLIYFVTGDWRHGLYWFFAAGITGTVTFGL